MITREPCVRPPHRPDADVVPPRSATARRRPARSWTILLLVACWAAAILGFYYSEISRLVLHPLGLSGPSKILRAGSVILPESASLGRMAGALWAVLGVILLGAGALALGRQILRASRLRSSQASSDLLPAVAVGLGAVSYLVFVLAAAGLLRSGVLTAFVVVLGVYAGIQAVRERAPLARHVRAVATLPSGSSRVVTLAGIAVLCVFLLTALIGALGPEIGFDALWYHLELPRTYLDSGGFVRLPEEFVSLYPQTVELLYAIGLDWGGVVAAKLVDLLFGVLLLLATYRLARRFVTPLWSLAAAVLVVAAPIVHWELTTAYVDVPTAFFVTVALTELVAWRDSLDRRHVIRAALVLGLALASKHLALLFLPAAVLVVALPLARVPGGWSGSGGARVVLGVRAVARGWKPIVLLPVIALLVAAPWYVRAAVITGDPVFPSLYSWLGAPREWFRHATQASLQNYLDGFGFGRSPLELVLLPWRLVTSPASFDASIGPFYLLAIPLLAFNARVRRSGLWVVGLFALGFVVLWASPLSSFQGRFLIPVLPALAVLAVAGLSSFVAWLRLNRFPRLAFGIPVGVFAIALLALPPFIPWNGPGYVGYALTEVNLAAAVDSRAARDTIASNVHGYWAIDYGNHHVPRDARILSLLEGGQFYSRNPRLVDYAPLAKPTTYDSEVGKEDEVYAALQEGDLSYVLVDKSRTDLQEYGLPIVGERFRNQYLRLLYEDEQAALYAVRAPDDVRPNLVDGFEESVVLDGLTLPVATAFAPDGRVFVAEKAGVIKVFDGFGDTTPVVFADLSAAVDDEWERGLLGLALDPAFPARPYLYVSYTANGPACVAPESCTAQGRVSRLTAQGDVMSGAEKILVEDWCQQFPSHSVGDLEFGPDGALYAAAGEGAGFAFADVGQKGDPPNPCGDPPGEGGALRSQDLRTAGDPVGLSGTVIRIDPDTGAGLRSDQLAGEGDENARRIVAYGLRNPYRIAFRPGTSELWIGDVGWDGFEEIDVIVDPLASPPANFGWPCFEGPERQARYDAADAPLCEQLYGGAGSVVAPAFAYDHGEAVVDGEPCPPGASAISGLAFYEGGTYPAAYDGALFVADYNRDCIWVLPAGPDGSPDLAAPKTFAGYAANPVDLAIGPAGDLYYTDLDGGTVRRIQPASG